MSYTPVHDHSFDAGTTFSLAEGDDRFAYHNALRQEHVERQPFSPGNNAADDRRKEFADVEFHEVSPYWTTATATPAPYGVPSGPSHQRGWSDSTIAAIDGGSRGAVNSDGEASKLSSSQEKKNNKKKTRMCATTEESWTLEGAGVIVALAAVGSIMGVLARFNGRSLPEWPYYITLNALIALLVTIATAAMGISLQSGLSQLKWIRFKEARAPLADMERFDEASRGTWGAVKLLATARGGYLGSFGAIVAITALALGPFAQQVVTYQTRTVESPVGASVNRALNYTGALPGNTSSTGFVPLLPLKSAVYNGLFAENGRPGAALAFECQTGNCTWDTYETLAVCASCVDLTPFIEPYCGGGNNNTNNDNDNDSNSSGNSSCGWQVPQGARLDTGAQVFSLTPQIPLARGDQPHSTIAKLLFMGTESRAGPAGSVQPWARQCALSACVQTLETRVANGALGERVVAEAVNRTVVDISDGRAGDRDVYVVVGGDASAGGDGATYVLGIEAMLAMRGWFASVFATGSAVRSGGDFNRTVTDGGGDDDDINNSGAVVVNLTVGISSGSTFFDSDVVTAFYWNYYEYDGGLDMLVRDVATSMTVAFRGFQGAEPVAGRAVSAESYVHVRWGFAALPIVVVVGAAAFLAAAVYRTGRSRARPWKSSALAVLLHGLDDDTRARLVRGDGLGEQKRWAKDIMVQLDESDGINGSLLRG